MVTYDFYTDTYHGNSIAENNWEALEREASAKLRQYKRKYTVIVPDENSESMAVCVMAETLDYFEAMQNGIGAAQSATIGSVSVSYSTQSVDLSPKGKERELYRSACLYLDIYRGVG